MIPLCHGRIAEVTSAWEEALRALWQVGGGAPQDPLRTWHLFRVAVQRARGDFPGKRDWKVERIDGMLELSL